MGRLWGRAVLGAVEELDCFFYPVLCKSIPIAPHLQALPI